MVAFRINLLLLSCLLILLYSCVQNPAVSVPPINARYTLTGDTLFSTENFKIYPGQKLICGKGSGENEWYNSISFKSPASWPLVVGRNMDLKYNSDYQRDEGIRDKDKVKEYLNPGDTLVVSKIKRRGNKKSGYWYVAHMRQGQGILSLQYTCYIAEAVRSKEILPVSE